ncbi:MAG: hypothetical protein IT431_00955 [Phycisphaerales bacterium]|nr:hypothetical protein [Phycisphaerales bacterium]
MAKQSKRGRRSATGLQKYTTAALVAERDRRRAALEQQAQATRKQLDEIERALAALGGAPKRPAPAAPAARRSRGTGARRGGSGGKGVPLAQAVTDALSKHGPMRVPDLIAAMRKAGYSSASPNLRSMVSQRLTQDGRFERVERGVYAIKATAKGE